MFVKHKIMAWKEATTLGRQLKRDKDMAFEPTSSCD